MGPSHFILVSALFAICASQRSPYAGRRPIGYPALEATTLATTTVAAATVSTATVAAATVSTATVATATAQNNTLGNRFDDNSTAAATATVAAAATVTTTTERLPIEALGDRDLLNRLGKLPQDKQPFWYLNWQALDLNRKQPQSYPLRHNSFAGNIAFPANNAAAQNPQQPLQNNQGIINPPLLSNQVLDNQRPFQNRPPFQNSPALTPQQRFRSAEYSDEFDSEY